MTAKPGGAPRQNGFPTLMSGREMSTLHILWDESHIWGLLAWRAAESMGLPYRLVRAQEIADGLLSRNPPALLLVPGGTARLKADALGDAGMRAVRGYVAGGGRYLGFCGGAGLGLTGEHGLGLCPWSRAAFTDRMQHFVSGHVHATVSAGHPLTPAGLAAEPALPVWWPGRFAPEDGHDVEILARYTEPGGDFWVADLPLDTLPPGTFAEWEDLYGIRLRPTFLAGQPCILHGACGKGSYTLSYTHLETPESPQANLWLAHLVERLTDGPTASGGPSGPGGPGGLRAATPLVPAWKLDALPARWHDGGLLRARALFDDIVTIGINHCLFFRRNSWLIGWRAGIPGANLNNLHAAVCTAVSTPPTPAAEAYWNERKEDFLHRLALFHKGVTGYLLAERLAMTLSKTFPETVSRHSLKEQRAALFGPPMASGGLYAELLDVLDQLVFLQLHG